MNNYIIIPRDSKSYRRLREQRYPELRSPSYDRYVALSRSSDEELVKHLTRLNVNALWFRIETEGAVARSANPFKT